MSNPYTANAAALMRDVEAVGEGRRPAPEAVQALTAAAQVSATLAVAYEQRTANLLAAANSKYADGSAMFPDLMGADEGIQIEIRERLQ